MFPRAVKSEQEILAYVDERRDRLVEIIQDLVRIPSENKPPNGVERAAQSYVAQFLKERNWNPLVYELTDVPGLVDHPLYWPGRDYRNRPNVGARRRGSGGGRSLILSGHIDTVPAGTLPWTRDPFGGQVEGNRLYGRGSNDMKAGVGIALFVVEAIGALGLQLAGDLILESVVDEEFGGVNGTLAGRLQGFNGDAAVVLEPSFLKVCPGHRGGRTAHITLHAEGGVLSEGRFPRGILDQLIYFLNQLEGFSTERRRTAKVHSLFAASTDPVPVSVLKVFTSPWGTSEPKTIPTACKLEVYWQVMPGETREDVDREFFDWLDRITRDAPQLFAEKPQVDLPYRWLPASVISEAEPVAQELAACAARVLGKEPSIEGLGAPCDMFIFHQAFGIPAVVWGPCGGNTHAADEYLEIDSAVAAAKSLLLFVCRWCGLD